MPPTRRRPPGPTRQRSPKKPPDPAARLLAKHSSNVEAKARKAELMAFEAAKLERAKEAEQLQLERAQEKARRKRRKKREVKKLEERAKDEMDAGSCGEVLHEGWNIDMEWEEPKIKRATTVLLSDPESEGEEIDELKPTPAPLTLFRNTATLSPPHVPTPDPAPPFPPQEDDVDMTIPTEPSQRLVDCPPVRRAFVLPPNYRPRLHAPFSESEEESDLTTSEEDEDEVVEEQIKLKKAPAKKATAKKGVQAKKGMGKKKKPPQTMAKARKKAGTK
ncbi:hypothetical protein BT69DRAFT_1280409 [Atractiella rhizophila]|nr:hypothetical protein BT69DRAFT_1280409 [Atractiella rhizophila]